MAKEIGIKPAARAWKTSPATVRKWLNRWDGTLDSLAEQSRAPKNHPNALTEKQKQQIIRAKKAYPNWGVRRLKYQLNLPFSVKTIHKVCKENDLNRRWRRKKHETKRCLRDVKKQWHAFQQICIDTKDLSDIPEYWPFMKFLGLPRYQYTARDVSTGLLFLGYSDQLSLTYSTVFAKYITTHLASLGVDLSSTTWQSDNGSEFIGSWNAKDDSVFTKAIESIEGQIHRTIPPGQHRFQADVETIHSLMETEFYEVEIHRDRQDFLARANTYNDFFNLVRKNSGKEYKTPLQLLKKNFPEEQCYRIARLPPQFLDRLFLLQGADVRGGNDVGELPSSANRDAEGCAF